jgi:hypothetical protein
MILKRDHRAGAQWCIHRITGQDSTSESGATPACR